MALNTFLSEQNINPLYFLGIFHLSSVFKDSDQRQHEVFAAADLWTTGLQDSSCKSLFLSFCFDHEVK